MSEPVLPDEPRTWADMTEWHLVRSVWGDFIERIDREALVGAVLPAQIRFQVIREEWVESTHPPVRIIREVKVL